MTSVLIIDDYPEDREFLADLLNDADPSTTVHACADGAGGLAKITELALDCVLLDLRLDGEDGLEVLSQMRDARPTLPIIVLTGQGSEEAAVEAFVAGAAYYLPKRNLTAKTLWIAVKRVLRQAQTESELKAKSRALERSNRLDAVGQLAAGIAHDFNNQLGTLRMTIELLKDAVATDRAGGHVRAALKVIQESAHLATRLLSLSQQADLLVKNVALSDVFSDLKTLASRSLADPVLLHVSDVDDDMIVHCDPSQLLNALLNLVMNANDAISETQEIGTISVTAMRQDDEVRIIVKDDGAGMSEDVLAKCRDPFFTTKQNRNGTGLGLAMVQSFAVESGGALLFSSKPDEGTEAIVVLPKGESTSPEEVVPAATKPIPCSDAKILLVDDEVILAMMTQELLKDAGFLVHIANSATEALDYLSTLQTLDLLITDIKMPGMSGIELAEEVRAPDVEIIYLTGYADISGNKKKEITGPILQKPVEPDELIATITKLLEAKK